MSRYLVGIDLGTTNIAVAYVDAKEKLTGTGPRLHSFRIPQMIAAGQVGAEELLPSFLYIPGSHDLPAESLVLPWKRDSTEVVGLFARSHGAKIPGRLVTSAKSWLCHAGVDRTAPLLPWAAPAEVRRFSPLEVSAKYLRHIVEAWNYTHAEKLEEQSVVLTVPASFDDVARNLTAEAAKQAGLKNVTLLEEPQAAFYAWLATHDPSEATKLKPGMRCLVVDVGGGTSDFSLIRVVEGQGDLAFERESVGDHLLLGGDNMDLALAKSIEAKLPYKLDAAQFGGLVQACRVAKEKLLEPNPPASHPVTVVGRGRGVVAGTVSISVTSDEVKKAIYDGFFPSVPFEANPQRGARSGLQEIGLPYVSDAAITRHLASFIREQMRDKPSVDALLFNGGVFQPQALQERLLEVMRPWFGRDWQPLLLSSPSLNLAVAWGAAYFAWLKHTGGRRIGGGIPRSYYVGVESHQSTESVSVLCVVPRRLLEGQDIVLTEPVLELAIGQPVLFPLYTSTIRGDDAAGAVLHLSSKQLLPLPPLHTILRGGKRAGTKRVPVTLAAKCTEIGTLELACVSKEGHRWKLEFNVRDVRQDAENETSTPTMMYVWPEEKVLAAGTLIDATFQGKESPPELPRKLESVLEATRSEWPTSLCRRLWEFLECNADGRARGPAHLSRWYNLVGFSLRPGFGDPLDRYRVESLWKLITSSASGTGQSALPEGGADFWIMWRRVAGGLNAALQQALFARLRPVLLPGKGKPPPKQSPNELAEMWRAAASLERIDSKTREALGATLLEQTDRLPPYLFWSLTRIGARVPLYGPLNNLVHVTVVEGWLDTLLSMNPESENDRLGWAFCLSQLARRSGLRAVDVDDTLRHRVLATLQRMAVPAAWPRMVEDIVSRESDERSRLFGESLPMGLRLAT